MAHILFQLSYTSNLLCQWVVAMTSQDEFGAPIALAFKKLGASDYSGPLSESTNVSVAIYNLVPFKGS